MNENIYLTPDKAIIGEIGKKIAWWRLRQDFSQAKLAEDAGVSLSSVQKIERGESTNFLILVKVLRTLRKLEGLEFFTREEGLSPREYYLAMEARGNKKHASHKRK